jgi:hypothetical protein
MPWGETKMKMKIASEAIKNIKRKRERRGRRQVIGAK